MNRRKQRECRAHRKKKEKFVDKKDEDHRCRPVRQNKRIEPKTCTSAIVSCWARKERRRLRARLSRRVVSSRKPLPLSRETTCFRKQNSLPPTSRDYLSP